MLNLVGIKVDLVNIYNIRSVTATQSIKEYSTIIQRAHTCMIGLSMNSDIKMRRRFRWWKGHVYIQGAKAQARAPN